MALPLEVKKTEAIETKYNMPIPHTAEPEICASIYWRTSSTNGLSQQNFA
jgi:hypothetical protein